MDIEARSPGRLGTKGRCRAHAGRVGRPRANVAMMLVVALGGCGGTTEIADPGRDGPGRDGPGRDGAPLRPDACTNVPGAPADRAPSAPQVLATGDGIYAVAVDATDVYFASGPQLSGYGHTSLKAVPKRGGAPRDVASAYGLELRCDADYVYLGGGGYGVERVGKHGEPGTQYSIDAFDFDLDEAHIYGASLGAGITRMGKDGTSPLHLADGDGAQGISVRDGWVYWANYPAHDVARVPTSGGASDTLATAPGYTRTIVADCEHAYFSVGNYGDEIWRTPLAGGAPAKFADVGGAVKVDAASLYVQNSEGTWRVSLADGATTSLGKGSGAPGLVTGSLAVDDEAVYWATGDAVMRAEK